MGISYGKVIGSILENVDGITLRLDVGTELGSLYGSFYGYNYDKLEGLLILDSLVSTDGKFPGSDEGIKLLISGGKVIGAILVNVDGITLGIYVGTEMESLDGSFDGSNYGNLEGLLLGDSLGFTDGKVLGSDEVIKLILSGGKVIGTIIENLD